MGHVNRSVPPLALTFQGARKVCLGATATSKCHRRGDSYTLEVKCVWGQYTSVHPAVPQKTGEKQISSGGKMQQCVRHWAVAGFSAVTDGAALKTMVKDTQPRCHETYPTSIFIDLLKLQVSRARIGLLIQCTTSIWQCVCLYSPDQTIHITSSSNWSKGQMAVQYGPCQIYDLLKALRHILTFSAQCITGFIHPWDMHLCQAHTGLERERAPCFSPSHCCPLKPCLLRLIWNAMF